MHVALIGSQASIHIIRWANSLSRRGVIVDLFTMHDPIESLNSEVRLRKLPFRNPYGYILNIPFLRKEIARIQPDIIHSFYALGHSFLGRMTGFKPHIISVLGSDIYDDTNKNIFRSIVEKNLKEAAAICSTSLIMAKQIKKYIDREIVITPFGIDTKQFKPIKTSSPDKKKEEFIIGTVKWLEDKYGIDILIASFAKFRKRYPEKNIKLYIVGDGSKKKKLQKLAISLGVESDCEFIGRVPHRKVHLWIQKFDVFAALSRLDSESFGVAILEASAMEVPVLVSNAGGLPEVVEESKTGIIVPKENINAAAAALEELYLNEKIRKKLGNSGRERVLEYYDWHNSVDKMIHLYKDVLMEY